MGEFLSSPWFITVVGGALASLIATLTAAYLVNRRPSILKLYRKALDQLHDESDLNFSEYEKHVLRQALNDPAVIKAIKTRTSDPGQEAQQLCKAIAHHAPSSSRLADPVFAARVVERLLYTEFIMEDTEQYQHSHNSRRPYFDIPPAPTGLSAAVTANQIMLTWNPVQHPGIYRYSIKRSTRLDEDFVELGHVPADTENLLRFTDEKELANEARYYYTVFAESSVLRRGHVSSPVSVNYDISPARTVKLEPESSPVEPESTSIQRALGMFFTSQEIWKEIASKSVDRKQDVEKLLTDFRKPGRRLFLIEGFGGLGKTTLAACLADAVSQRYNILWVECQGIPVTAERFLREMGEVATTQYGYPFLRAIIENPQHSQQEKNDGLFDFLAVTGRSKNALAIKPIMFFFDDYHLVADAALKRLVLQIAESHLEVKVVLVLRYLPSELQDEVDAAPALQLQGLDVDGCRELIEVYASKFPALRDIGMERLQRIWEITGQGVPAALRILIALTRKLSLDDVLEELPTLTAATREKWFDKLFYELSSEEQQVASEASIFRRPISRHALINISRCNRASYVIDSLVDRFVLTFDGKHYSMHALWSDYTGQHLSPSDTKELHRKAALYYRSFVTKDRYLEVMSHLESCYHFIQAEDMEQAESELMPIAIILRSWGLYQELTGILNEIEKHHAAQSKQLNPHLSLEKSAIRYAQGAVDEAIAILEVSANTHTGEIQIRALLELGLIYIETGKRREAERLLKLSREFAHQSGLLKLEAEALTHLQHMTYHECDYRLTLAYNEERLSILQQMQDDLEVREAIAWIHHDIGNVYREQGFYTKAMELYLQDQALWNESGNPPRRVGWITYDIGQVYREQGKLREAQTQFEEALQFFTRMQHLFGIAHAKIELGRVGARLGPSEPAIQQVNEAIDLLRKVKGVAGEAYARGALGQIYLGLGKPDLALSYFQQALKMETELGSIKGRAWSLHQFSLTYEQQGKRNLLSDNRREACKSFCEAAEMIVQAQELYAQIGATPNIYDIHDNSVRIQQACAGCTDVV
jgi:tetratricopeptide (TPR) repeat protein